MQEDRELERQIPLEPAAIRENVDDQYLMELTEARRRLEKAAQWGEVKRTLEQETLSVLYDQINTLARLIEAQTMTVKSAYEGTAAVAHG